MNDYINQVFGPDGCLAARFEGYAPREGQIAFARAVDDAIRSGDHLVGECPTGTGKSIGYGVPATYHAAHHKKRVLIVTANIALQEQLVSKDLPLLAEILPWDFSYALIKGKSNYLCHDRLYQEEAKGTLTLLDDPGDGDKLEALIEWARSTDRGDVSELDFEPPYRLWRRFSTTPDECKGSDCRFREECCSLRARAAAHEADVIVCNYHLLFAHLQVKEATEQDLVLPAFDVAILDEAHKTADIARDFFGYRVTPGAVRWTGRPLKKFGAKDVQNALAKESDRFFDNLARYRSSRAYRTRLKNPNAVPWEGLVGALNNVGNACLAATGRTADSDERSDLSRAAARSSTLALQIEQAMTLTDEDSVVFISDAPRGGVILCAKPIHVADRLRRLLFDATHSVTLTSATLATGSSFNHLVEEVGIPRPKELVVESPFTFDEQALLIVPSDMPAPNDPEYSSAVAEAVAEILELAGGRTLGLFTSYRNLNAAYDRVAGNGHRVLRQGDMPRTQLVEEFRRDVNSVLLGTESFWAGVDVPGEALSCVIIDRLPFTSPEDPILDAISERDRNWFRNYSLPRAIIAFKQGFGRLIRSTSDRGVVVVLDQRLVTKSYGRLFISSIPDLLKSRQLENVRQFLAEAA